MFQLNSSIRCDIIILQGKLYGVCRRRGLYRFVACCVYWRNGVYEAKVGAIYRNPT